MERYKYVCIKLDDVPEEIIQQYLLQDKVDIEGYIFIEVQKGMYGLPQAGISAQNLLEKCLNKHGYFQRRQYLGFGVTTLGRSALLLLMILASNTSEKSMRCIC